LYLPIKPYSLYQPPPNHDDLGGIVADNHHARYTNGEAVTAAKTVKLDDFATPDDNADLNFSTLRHGLVPKGTNVGDFLKDDGTWAVAAGKSIATGSYVGDNTDNRQISVGFKCSLVIALYTWDFCAVIIPGKASSFNSVLTGGTPPMTTLGRNNQPATPSLTGFDTTVSRHLHLSQGWLR